MKRMKKSNNVVQKIKRSSKGLAVTIIILVIMLLAVGCYFSYNKYLAKDTTNAKYFVFDSSTGTIMHYSAKGPKNVVIPSKINGVSVKSIASSAFMFDKLTSVDIPSSVTTIGDEAFAENKLTSVIISNGVTTIGELAFLNNSITSIVIPESVTTIGKGAFNKNKLPDNQAFIYKRNGDGSVDYTTIVSYGGVNKNPTIPSNVTTILQLAFAYNGITSIVIPSSVTAIQYEAFRNNPVKSVTIQGDNLQRFNENWSDIGFGSASRP